MRSADGSDEAPSEVATKRALIASSTDVIVPVHQDKLGVVAPFAVAELDAVDVVVTDAKLPAGLKRACKRAGHEVVVS